MCWEVDLKTDLTCCGKRCQKSLFYGSAFINCSQRLLFPRILDMVRLITSTANFRCLTTRINQALAHLHSSDFHPIHSPMPSHLLSPRFIALLNQGVKRVVASAKQRTKGKSTVHKGSRAVSETENKGIEALRTMEVVSSREVSRTSSRVQECL